MTHPSGLPSGILAAGTYLPSTAVTTRRGVIPVCNGDEDAVTLAIEAGLRCLDAALTPDHATENIDELLLVAGTETSLSGGQGEVVRTALGLPATTRVAISSGLDRLGAVTAMLNGLDAVVAGRISRALIIATETGDERHVGAGAAAVMIGRADDPAVQIHTVNTVGVVVYDRWHAPDVGLGSNEPRYIQQTIERNLAEVFGNDQQPPEPVFLTGAVWPGAPVGATVLPDYGTAGPLFALIVGARKSAKSFTVAVAASSRSALLRCAAGATARQLADPGLDAVLAGGEREPAVSPMLSLPSSSPFFERSSTELLRLEAAQCRRCGHIVFPPTQRPICAGCRGADFDPHPLSRRGSVYTFTVNRFLPVGFGAKMILVLAELDDGYRYWAPTSGIAADDIAIGTPVRLGVRRFTNHGGVAVYAMKFLSDTETPSKATLSDASQGSR